jgi:hypothetical protein
VALTSLVYRILKKRLINPIGSSALAIDVGAINEKLRIKEERLSLT